MKHRNSPSSQPCMATSELAPTILIGSSNSAPARYVKCVMGGEVEKVIHYLKFFYIREKSILASTLFLEFA